MKLLSINHNKEGMVVWVEVAPKQKRGYIITKEELYFHPNVNKSLQYSSLNESIILNYVKNYKMLNVNR